MYSWPLNNAMVRGVDVLHLKILVLLHSQPSVPAIRHLWIQSTMDHVVLYHWKKKSMYKYTHTIQTCFILGSTVLTNVRDQHLFWNISSTPKINTVLTTSLPFLPSFKPLVTTNLPSVSTNLPHMNFIKIPRFNINSLAVCPKITGNDKHTSFIRLWPLPQKKMNSPIISGGTVIFYQFISLHKCQW